MAHISNIQSINELNPSTADNGITSEADGMLISTSDSLQRDDQDSVKSEVARSSMKKRFLVIANVSKKQKSNFN